MKKIALIIILVLFIFLLNFRLLVYNTDFYYEEFEKIPITIEKETSQIETQKLISYFKGKNELSNFFNEKEKLHLKDVKNLINKTNYIFYITLILLPILIYFNKKNLKKLFLLSSIISILIILIFYLINFENFFNNTFHQLLFNNDLYLLDPEKDNLINLFPYQFFQDFTHKMFLNTLIINLIILIITLFLFRKQILKILSIRSK